jgi:hypothetical protein
MKTPCSHKECIESATIIDHPVLITGRDRFPAFSLPSQRMAKNPESHFLMNWLKTITNGKKPYEISL